ncbi:MAG: DUF1576 domain-containing protein [Alkalispirochaeta sp.]
MRPSERPLYGTLLLVIGFCLALGVAISGWSVFADAGALQFIPARLIQDYTGAVGGGTAGAAAALVNAALVALLSLILIWANNITLSGPTVAAVFTILGFGLFGKTVFNAVPIFLGVFIAARFAGKRFGEYIVIALFGTALGPVVSTIAFEVGAGWWPIPLSIAGGLVVGFFLPPAAIAMLRMHEGYSLYNIGLTSGFLGLFAASFIRDAAGIDLVGIPGWNDLPAEILTWVIPAISVILFGSGTILGGLRTIADQGRINRIPGRLPSDFMDMVSPGASLVNMGILGVLFWVYTVAIGAPHNGPVIGGILTVIGFGAFGKSPRNTWPPVLGVIVATLLYSRGLTSPGPLLAIYFVTTLAPLAGEFGPVIGFIAGFIHLSMVLHTGGWHGGMNLYNNGFAGGITATLIIAVIEWFRSTHDETFRRWRKG